jgi:hypothetical protein
MNDHRYIAVIMSLIVISSMLIISLVITTQSKSVCDLIDSGAYFTRLCNYGYIDDIKGPIVAIGKTVNNKSDGDVSRIGINLSPRELHKLSCLVRCHEAYNITY